MAEHSTEAAGMPQLDFSAYPNLIFWLLVTLVIVYLILTRLALPRIASVLSERQGTITSDLAAAEELKEKAKEAEAAYDQALADARAQAQEIVARTKAGIQKELDEAVQKADAEIAARTAESEKAIAEIRRSAMDSVKDVANDVAGEIVSALGTRADAKAIKAAVAAQLKGLG